MRLKEGDHHPSAGVPPPVTEEPSRHAASLDPLAALSPARGTARRERWDVALAGTETEPASLQSHCHHPPLMGRQPHSEKVMPQAPSGGCVPVDRSARFAHQSPL